MENIADIGIYAYINLTFSSFIKSNKILYYKLLIKNPVFLALHIEWLHTCPFAFNSTIFEEDCLSDGVEQSVRNHYCHDTEEMILRRIHYFQSEAYQLQRYTNNSALHRSSNLLPLEDVAHSGIYYYINYYTRGGINLKIQTFQRLIANEEYLQCHCAALFEHTHCDHIHTKSEMECTDLPNLVYYDSMQYFKIFAQHKSTDTEDIENSLPYPLDM